MSNMQSREPWSAIGCLDRFRCEKFDSAVITEREDTRMAPDVRSRYDGTAVQLLSVDLEIHAVERCIRAHYRSSSIRQGRAASLCTGPIIAGALMDSVTDPAMFLFGTVASQVDRAGTEAELDRRQAAVGPRLPSRSPQFAMASDRGRYVGHPSSQVGRHE